MIPGTSMVKELRTERQLEALIRAQAKDINIQHLEVHPDKAFGELGWDAFVMEASPERAFEYGNRVQMIASRLRVKYDLRA
ncbi:MAG: hypothetical protein JO188_21740 [Hyphomicrobiales bacterium]|nr:hypothetical protein [Hyphomicrobiales bacterium]